jgi:hypothetical protein
MVSSAGNQRCSGISGAYGETGNAGCKAMRFSGREIIEYFATRKGEMDSNAKRDQPLAAGGVGEDTRRSNCKSLAVTAD